MKARETSQRVLAVLATVLVLAVVAALVRPHIFQRDAETSENGLDAVIRRMLRAAQEGDLAGYVDCFGGELRQKLTARLFHRPHDQAAAELRGGVQGLKSVVSTVRQQSAPGQATLVLERIYTDYNERHLVHLERIGAEWKIVSLTPQERFAPEIPYGTRVDQPPGPLDAGRATQPARTSDADR